MKYSKSFDDSPANSPKEKTIPLFTHENTIAVYTVLSILRIMKSQLGMEAMLEYMGKYLSHIEKNNLNFKDAVTEALSLMNIEKMYKDAVRCEEK